MDMGKKQKIISKTLLFCFVVTLIFWPFSYNKALAVSYLPSPFGGKVISVTYCTCQYTAWMLPRMVVVGPPNGGTFMYTIFALLYEHWLVSPGRWILGMAAGSMPCMMTAGYACYSVGSYKMIYMVGTSLY